MSECNPSSQAHCGAPPEQNDSCEYLRGTAILGRYEYRPDGGTFDGAEIRAIIGGFEIDLRRVSMKRESARIDLFSFLGGGEIILPRGWEVSIQVSAIVGGVDDQTIKSPEWEGKRHRLLLTGTLVLGGLVVR